MQPTLGSDDAAVVAQRPTKAKVELPAVHVGDGPAGLVYDESAGGVILWGAHVMSAHRNAFCNTKGWKRTQIFSSYFGLTEPGRRR